VLRLPKTESFLAGKEFNLDTMTAAGDIAVTEITPITDVRGGDEYRFQLAKSVLLKFLHEVRPEGVPA
jgi:xanthine dehydrogenase iron-sulfur cluster and FAD-binding subunit A